MSFPAFPLIAISEQDSLYLLADEHTLEKASASTLIQQENNGYLYDARGKKWSFLLSAEGFKNTWLTRLLAHTVYNPLYNVSVKWTDHGNYDLYGLKEEINRCVDADDDVITQFAEDEVIKEAVNNAVSFSQLVTLLKKYIFDVNEKELWKEQESRKKI